jgi:hypothetical protein
MAKSMGQRATELLALGMVGGVAIFFGVGWWKSRPKTEEVRLHAAVPEAPAAPIAAPQPPPEDPESPLPAAADDAVKKLILTEYPHRYRMPDMRFPFSPDGKYAVLPVVSEDEATRGYALHDLDERKVVRLLSAEIGRGTKPFRGTIEGDHGADTTLSQDFYAGGFSPDGKRVALLTRPVETSFDRVLAWNIESGELLLDYQECEHRTNMCCFVGPDKIAAAIAYDVQGYGVELIDVNDGTAELIVPFRRITAIRAAEAWNNKLIVQDTMRFYSYTVDDDATQNLPAAGGDAGRRNRMAYSADGKLMMLRGNLCEWWDLATGKRDSATMFRAVPQEPDKAWLAPDASFVLFRPNYNSGFVEIWEAEAGTRHAVILLRKARGELLAVDSKARRALFVVNRKLIQLDFPDGIPPGTISLADLLERQAAEVTQAN